MIEHPGAIHSAGSGNLPCHRVSSWKTVNVDMGTHLPKTQEIDLPDRCFPEKQRFCQRPKAFKTIEFRGGKVLPQRDMTKRSQDKISRKRHVSHMVGPGETVPDHHTVISVQLRTDRTSLFHSCVPSEKAIRKHPAPNPAMPGFRTFPKRIELNRFSTV